MLKKIVNFWQKTRLNWRVVLFFILLFWIYWTNTFHTNFPDEFDNIVGGWYITQGKLPYIGFFSHHNPGAYYIASLITLITKQSFVKFRMVWAILLFITASLSYRYLQKKFTFQKIQLCIFLFLLGVSSTYYWGHMILSETVVGYAFIPIYALILFKYLNRRELDLKEIWVISVACAITLLTSLTFIYAISIYLLLVIYLFIKKYSLFSKTTFKMLTMLILPYLFFIVYLLVTGSLSEFYFQSIQYNKDYYIYNFPKVAGQVSKHPVRYATSIYYNTSDQFRALLLQVKDFNFAYPVNITLILGNAILLIYLISKKRYFLAISIYLILIFLNARGEPLNSQETDFHSTVYIMVSLFNITLILSTLFQDINKPLNQSLRLIYQGMFILLFSYSFFILIFFIKNFSDKAYARFMGNAPAIYDAPVAAPIINKIVDKNEYFWIGPFELQELLYINSKLPSKYYWFLPANERSEKIKSEITVDLLNHRPKLIVFKDYWQTFNVPPAQFNYPIMNILHQYYFRLSDLIPPVGKKYEVIPKGLHNFDIWTDFYFDKARQEEIMQILINQNIVKLELD